jgi:hypothetical protein
MSKHAAYLFPENPIMFYPSLAKALGVNKALMIQHLHFLLNGKRTAKDTYSYIDGKWWVYNNYEEWQRDQFIWLSESAIKRLFLELEEAGLVISRQSVKNPSDRKKWYTIDYAKWSGFAATIGQNQDDEPSYQNETMEIGQNQDDGYSKNSPKKTKKTTSAAKRAAGSESILDANSKENPSHQLKQAKNEDPLSKVAVKVFPQLEIVLWNEYARYTVYMTTGAINPRNTNGIADFAYNSSAENDALPSTIKLWLLNIVRKLPENILQQPANDPFISVSFELKESAPHTDRNSQAQPDISYIGFECSISQQGNQTGPLVGNVAFAVLPTNQLHSSILTVSCQDQQAANMWRETCKSFVQTATNAKATISKTGANKIKSPLSPAERDALFDAVILHVFKIASPEQYAEAKESDNAGTRAGMISNWLAQGCDKIQNKKVGAISRPATPDHVQKFSAWYATAKPRISIPKDAEKFIEAWREWASLKHVQDSQRQQRQQPAMPSAQPLTDEQLKQRQADIAARRNGVTA